MADAEAAYAGPFLDGVHFKGCLELERWIDAHRERIDRAHATVLHALADTPVDRSEALSEGAKSTRSVRAAWPVRRAALAASVVVIAASLYVGMARVSGSRTSFTDEWTAEHEAIVTEREHSTRGRVFIETPVVQAPSPALVSLAALVAVELTNAVSRTRVAHPVPRDTVLAVEAAAGERGWMEHAAKTLEPGQRPNRRDDGPLGTWTAPRLLA